MEISVVIPTRNRHESLCRCLSSLAAQTHPLKEIVIVDASDEQLDLRGLEKLFPGLDFIVLKASPSVCGQRNKGIQLAKSQHILLCDDDIEFPPNYVAALADFLIDHQECGAISGTLIERSDGEFTDTLQQKLTLPALCWRFLFQLTIWTDLSLLQTSSFGQILLSPIKNFYHKRDNTFTLAGWPLVTQIGTDSLRTSIFGLGAALVRRDWLLTSPFDESLDLFGIGDNYGVAINFPDDKPIVVLRGVSAIHHRSDVNRLPTTTTYYRRILALDYFMSRSARFTWFNRLMLRWSLLGNFVPQVFHLDFNRAYATMKACILLAAGHNPYLAAAKSGKREPVVPTP